MGISSLAINVDAHVIDVSIDNDNRQSFAAGAIIDSWRIKLYPPRLRALRAMIRATRARFSGKISLAKRIIIQYDSQVSF